MNAVSVLEVVVRVIGELECLAIPYHVGGSVASTIHGVPRQTRDVDIVVDLGAPQGARVAAAWSGDFYTLA